MTNSRYGILADEATISGKRVKKPTIKYVGDELTIPTVSEKNPNPKPGGDSNSIKPQKQCASVGVSSTMSKSKSKSAKTTRGVTVMAKVTKPANVKTTRRKPVMVKIEDEPDEDNEEVVVVHKRTRSAPSGIPSDKKPQPISNASLLVRPNGSELLALQHAHERQLTELKAENARMLRETNKALADAVSKLATEVEEKKVFQQKNDLQG